MAPYSILDHVADIGLRIEGGDLPTLFRSAAQGLFDLITDAQKIVPLSVEQVFEIRAKDLSDLFLKWLRELLFTFSTKKLIFADFEFTRLSRTHLQAKAHGGIFDPKRHPQRYEIKAVTYHGFKIEKKKEGWIAEVIFDI